MIHTTRRFFLLSYICLQCFAILQPISFKSALSRLERPQQELLLTSIPKDPLRSVLKIYEKSAFPESQGWSRCKDCGLEEDGRVLLFDPDELPRKNSDVLISWSLWGEFFHKSRNDRYYAKLVNNKEFKGNYYIERPVFVLPIITLHVGHILIDVLEQLYHTHMKLYGKIRRDCVIILDVASEFERPVLTEKIHRTINAEDGTVGTLLRLFTDLPVYGIDLWNELRTFEGVIFRDLHIGLDISQTFFNAGQRSQPCIVSLQHGNIDNLRQAERYREFSRFVQSKKPQAKSFEMEKAASHPTIFIEQRLKNRVILNMDELLRVSAEMGYSTGVGNLDNISFQEQLKLFSQVDVLVSMAGTALHNVLFLRPGSAVVIFMQPLWCEWAWMYANQAVLLGIEPYIYCTPSIPPVLPYPLASNNSGEYKPAGPTSIHSPALFRHYQWSRNFWTQGPRFHKSDNFSVDPAIFAQLLGDAVRYTQRRKSSQWSEDTPLELLRRDKSYSPMMCTGYTPSLHTGNLRSEALSSEVDNTSFTPSARTVLNPILHLYITSVSVEFISQDVGWKLGIVGEIGAAQSKIALLMRSMPHLSFCMETVDTPPWCYPIAAFNYYTDLFLDMALPEQNLHFWAQTSSTGGKIRHSDVYIALDCRLPSAGLDLHTQVIGLDVDFEVIVQHRCTDLSSESSQGKNQILSQVLRFPSRKYGTKRLHCASSEKVHFQHRFVSRLSLQRFSADFCAVNHLSGPNCVEFVMELQTHLKRLLRGRSLQLPPVQVAPTRANPFFFLHIEKTAGSTLREFIHASISEPNKTAFIPCHTEHCAVFAVPMHRPHTVDADSPATASHGEENEHVMSNNLEDLRLIQPKARDNSNLTVFAGHFDFYSVVNSLPQCAAPGTSHGTELAGSTTTGPWSPHVLSRIDPNRPTVPRTPVGTPDCRVSCFTVGRHPVDRAISYYYQRYYKRPDKGGAASAEEPVEVRPLEQRMINELTPEQLEHIALATREGLASHFYPDSQVFIDEGMCDAACSAMLGLKYTSGQAVTGLTSIPPMLPAALYPQAVANLQQCVVGIQEQWNDTLRVLDHWHPWIDFSGDPTRRKMSLYKETETRKTLRPELYQVLVALNPCDMMLYEEMLRLFYKQLSALDDYDDTMYKT